MANGNAFWMDTMLPSLVTGAISTASNLGIMAAQNKFNAEQAQVARDWNLEMDNTKYQRAVVDMQRAGVNPALMMSKGPISTQAATNISAQGATPAYMNMSNVAQMAQAISAAKLNAAQARNLDTDSKLKEMQANYYYNLGEKTYQEAVGVKIDNAYKDEFNQLEVQGKKLANSMTEERIKEVTENVNRLKAETDLAIKQAATEEEKVRLMVTQEALNKASANRIEQLLEYEKAYMSAQTEQAKASAGLMLVQAAYQQGLIDNGAIEATVKKMYADANDADARAIYTMTKHRLGFEQAEFDKIASETSLNNVKKATAVINTITDGIAKVIDAAIPL